MQEKQVNLPRELGASFPGGASPFFDCRVLWKVEVDDAYVVKGHWNKGFTHHGLFFTYGGCGRMEVPGKNILLKPFSLFILKDGTPCRYECLKNGVWEFFCLQFKRPDSLKLWGMDFNTLYESMSVGRLKTLFETMLRESEEREPVFGLKIDGLVNEFLVSFARESVLESKRGAAPVERARSWMHKHMGEKLDLELLVRESGLCRTSFFKAFQALTRKSPVNYFNDLKLDAARLMLEEHQATVREIGNSLGFYDEYYFSRMFKRKYGLSPSHYQQKRS